MYIAMYLFNDIVKHLKWLGPTDDQTIGFVDDRMIEWSKKGLERHICIRSHLLPSRIGNVPTVSIANTTEMNSYVWVRPLQCFEQFRYPSSLFVSAFPEIVYYFHSSKPRPCFLLQYLDKSTPSRIYAPPHSQAPASFQWRVICLNYSSSMIMFFAFQKIFLLLDFVRLAGLLLDLEKLE